MNATLANRRVELIQLFVYVPQLRALLRGEQVAQDTTARLSPMIHEGDETLARDITDSEVASARRATAGRFAEVFPAGI